MSPAKLLAALFCFLAFSASAQERAIQPPPAKAAATGTNHALVIGISNYHNIPHLLYADDDAYLFANYLQDAQICEKRNIVTLIDSVATKANIFKELKRTLDKAQPNDRVFIYFAGHGDVENEIESGFLLTYNCEANNYPGSDAIDINMLERYVQAFVKRDVKVVLISDACRSGSLAGGMSGTNLTLSSLNKGFQSVVKILSCQPNELSLEKKFPGGGHGIFTYHLVNGLRGLADRDNDKIIDLRELDRYLDEVVLETNKRQSPKVDGDPSAPIGSYNESVKAQALASKAAAHDTARLEKKRGRRDTTWADNPYFIQFNEQLRQAAYLEPKDRNALATLLKAEREKQPAELIQDMRLELSAAMEDEVQKWINRYLRGELDTRKTAMVAEIGKVRRLLETIEMLMGESDFRFHEIQARTKFFTAYQIYCQFKVADFPRAVSLLEEANRLQPNQAWILNAMGIIYARIAAAIDPGAVENAEEAYRKAIALAPSWTFPRLNLAILFTSLNRWPEAEALYRGILDKDPENAAAWVNLAAVYFEAGKNKEAESTLRIVLRMKPKHVPAWINLGNLYRSESRLDIAEKAYETALEFDSVNVDAWYNLGLLQLHDRKRYSTAAYCFRQAIELDPLVEDHWDNLFVALEAAKDPKELATWNERKKLYYFNDSLLPRKIAQYAGDSALLQQMETYNQQLLSSDPTQLFATYRLAVLHTLLGDKTRALAYIDALLKNGYRNFDYLEFDSDLAALRKESAFRKLLKKYK